MLAGRAGLPDDFGRPGGRTRQLNGPFDRAGVRVLGIANVQDRDANARRLGHRVLAFVAALFRDNRLQQNGETVAHTGEHVARHPGRVRIVDVGRGLVQDFENMANVQILVRIVADLHQVGWPGERGWTIGSAKGEGPFPPVAHGLQILPQRQRNRLLRAIWDFHGHAMLRPVLQPALLPAVKTPGR